MSYQRISRWLVSLVLVVSLFSVVRSSFARTRNQIIKEYGENLLVNGDFEYGLKGWDSNFAEVEKSIKKSGSFCIKLEDKSSTERMWLRYFLPELAGYLNSGKEIYAEAWYYIDKEPENEKFGISALGMGPSYDFHISLLPNRKIKIHAYSGKGWVDYIAQYQYPLREWFKLGILYNKQNLLMKVYFNDKYIGRYLQNFMKKDCPSTIGLGGTYPDDNRGTIYVDNAYCGMREPPKLETFTIEAENYTRFDEESIALPRIFERKSASGGKGACVRRSDVGEPTWLEYDFEIKQDSLYELYVVAGGNNCSQAGYISIDGGEEVLVEDNNCKEDEFVSYLVGVVKLEKGKHTIRIRHCEKEGYSNTFGIDKIELRRLEEDIEPTISTGQVAY